MTELNIKIDKKTGKVKEVDVQDPEQIKFGHNLKGSTGEKGEQGKAGLRGRTGGKGEKGADGKDYDPAIEKMVIGNKKYITEQKKIIENSARNIYTLDSNITAHIQDEDIHFDDKEQKDDVLRHLQHDHFTIANIGGGGGTGVGVVKAVSATIAADASWDGETIPFLYVPKRIQVKKVIGTTITSDNGKLSFRLESRSLSTLNSAGTNLMTANLVADSDSSITTTFSSASVAKNNYIVFITDTSAVTVGTVTTVIVTVEYVVK